MRSTLWAIWLFVPAPFFSAQEPIVRSTLWAIWLLVPDPFFSAQEPIVRSTLWAIWLFVPDPFFSAQPRPPENLILRLRWNFALPVHSPGVNAGPFAKMPAGQPAPANSAEWRCRLAWVTRSKEESAQSTTGQDSTFSEHRQPPQPRWHFRPE